MRFVGREADVSSLFCDQEVKLVLIAALGEMRDVVQENT